MAGCDDRERIAAVGSADRTHGVRTADLCGDLRISARLAERNRPQCRPHFGLARGADEIERQVECAALPGEVFAQLPLGTPECRMLRPRDEPADQIGRAAWRESVWQA